MLPHPPYRAPLVLLLGAATVAVAGGCADRSASPQATAQGTLQTFVEQCARGDALRILDELNPAARRVFVDAAGPAAGCAAILGLPAVAPGDLSAARVSVEAFDGARASFRVQLRTRATTVALARGSEGWRIEGPTA